MLAFPQEQNKKLLISDWKRIFEVNTLGIVNCVEQLLPDFMERKEGMIVGVTSLAESRVSREAVFIMPVKLLQLCCLKV